MNCGNTQSHASVGSIDIPTMNICYVCRWIDPPPNERALSCPSVPVSLCSLDNSVWSLSNETDQYNPIISVRIKRFWQTLHFAQHTLSSSSAGHGVAHIPRTWPVVVLSSALVHFPCSHSLTFFRAHIPLEPIHDKNCTTINPFGLRRLQLLLHSTSFTRPSTTTLTHYSLNVMPL